MRNLQQILLTKKQPESNHKTIRIQPDHYFHRTPQVQASKKIQINKPKDTTPLKDSENKIKQVLPSTNIPSGKKYYQKQTSSNTIRNKKENLLSRNLFSDSNDSDVNENQNEKNLRVQGQTFIKKNLLKFIPVLLIGVFIYIFIVGRKRQNKQPIVEQKDQKQFKDPFGYIYKSISFKKNEESQQEFQEGSNIQQLYNLTAENLVSDLINRIRITDEIEWNEIQVQLSKKYSKEIKKILRDKIFEKIKFHKILQIEAGKIKLKKQWWTFYN